MSTSNRTLLAEAATAAALVFALACLVSADDLAMRELGFHPAWLAITVLAARYGGAGLYVGMIIVWGPLILATLAIDGSLEALSLRAYGFSSLLAVGTAVAVAWVAMSHERRHATVSAKLARALEERDRTDESVDAMQASLTALRTRCDRIDSSVSFWRSIARCLERGDPGEAARAALELCSIRCGASAGLVQRWREADSHGFDSQGAAVVAQRGHHVARPTDLSRDRTALAACEAGVPMTASDVPEATEYDSDVAIPVLDDLDGSVLGVIGLRGIDPSTLQAASMRDLTLIADWLSPSLAVARGPRLRAVPEETA
jgi:hypothetical protein